MQLLICTVSESLRVVRLIPIGPSDLPEGTLDSLVPNATLGSGVAALCSKRCSVDMLSALLPLIGSFYCFGSNDRPAEEYRLLSHRFMVTTDNQWFSAVPFYH